MLVGHRDASGEIYVAAFADCTKRPGFRKSEHPLTGLRIEKHGNYWLIFRLTRGQQQLLSTWPSEQAADREARRLLST